MPVLFVCPSTVSSGEAITAQHMARDIVACGDDVRFLASSLAAGFVRDTAAEVTLLDENPGANRRAWWDVIKRFRPNVVVFADYPLLFFPSGTVPLADDAWIADLETLDAALVTLDHLGYAQRPRTVFFGPPHLSMAGASTPELPARMAVALPSPIHEPGFVTDRVGRPFRAWDAPAPLSTDEARATRERHSVTGDEPLILHSVPQWGWRAAEAWNLPYYRLLPRLLGDWFTGVRRNVTVLSVNDGRLLPPAGRDDVRIVNLAPLPPSEFERLLLAADLVLTENSVSVGLGKAACTPRPAAVIRNSHRLSDLLETADDATRRLLFDMEAARLGAVFPFEVFPIWGRADLDDLGIHRDNRFVRTFAWLEAFGGASTRDAVHALLLDSDVRSALCVEQEKYARAIGELPGPTELLARTAA